MKQQTTMAHWQSVTLVTATWVVIGFLVGCSHLVPDLVVDRSDGSTEVPSFDLMNDTRVLVIHGMSSQLDSGYSKDWHLIARLISDATELKEPGDCLQGEPTRSTLLCTLFHFVTDANNTIRIYELNYSNMTHNRQESLMNWDRRLAERSDFVNRWVKDEIVISRLGDVSMYLGPDGEIIRDRVKDVVKKATAEEDARVIIVALSLGSNIVMDTILEMLGPTQSNSDDSICRVNTIYFLSNQWAILNNPEDENDGSGAGSVRFPLMSTFSKVLQKLSSNCKELPTVVAFTDRNDLLGIPLPTGEVCKNVQNGNCHEAIVNVILNGAKLGIPFLLTDPFSAHSGYVDDPKVVECIMDGCRGRRLRIHGKTAHRANPGPQTVGDRR